MTCWTRFKKHGLEPNLVAMRAPSDRLAKQLERLKKAPQINDGISVDLTAFGLRHAFAIRLAELGLNYQEAAALCGHDPATHIAVYGSDWNLRDCWRKFAKHGQEQQRRWSNGTV